MENPRSRSTQKCLKSTNSVDILIRKRPVCPSKRSRSLKLQEVVHTPRKVGTPKKRIRVLSPNGRIEIMGSPESKRYSSARKIDFNG